MRLFRPFFARSFVLSSRRAPIAIIKATSPEANRSPIIIEAIIASVISNAEEILLIPLFFISLITARYNNGIPLITIVTQARFTHLGNPVLGKIKEARRNIPPMIVIDKLSNCFTIFLII